VATSAPAAPPLPWLAPLLHRTIEVSAVTVHRLGTDVAGGSVVQAVVPAGSWQAARSLGAWSLVGCIVAPAFDFAGFELAPPGWEPPVS
jgi:predicted cupin superfamily sugar epimerase